MASNGNKITDETIAGLVQQHLIHDTLNEDGSVTLGGTTETIDSDNSNEISPPIEAEIPVPYHLPGTAITHDIYAHANSLVMATHSVPRSKSLSDIKQKAGKLIHDDEIYDSMSSDNDDGPTDEFENLDKPGGFRRFHVKQQHRLANELTQDNIQPENAFQELFRPDSVCSGESRQDYTSGLYKLDSYQPTKNPTTTRHFLEYLAMTSAINQFAGEDLSDSEDDSPADDDEEQQVSESTSLLPNRRKRRHSIQKKKKTEHKANVTKTVFLLFKAFIGSGILFLPKAFSNGGLLFSIITMWIMGAVSLYCFLLLLDCKKYLTGSYGDMGGQLYGPWMRSIVLFSIAVSQVCIYYYFLNNLLDFICVDFYFLIVRWVLCVVVQFLS